MIADALIGSIGLVFAWLRLIMTID